MATKKKAPKKTVKRTTRQAIVELDASKRVLQDAFNRGVRQARNDIDQFILTLNNAAAFTVLEQLRAEWTRIDASNADSDLRPLRIEVYQGSDKDWYWRAIAGNGEIVADSGEGYTREADAYRARDQFIALVKAM